MKSRSQAHENRRCFPAGMLLQLLLHRRFLQRAAQIGAELFLMLEGSRSLRGMCGCDTQATSLETCTSEVRTRAGSATLCCESLAPFTRC